MVSIVGFDFSRQLAFLLGLIIPAFCSVQGIAGVKLGKEMDGKVGRVQSLLSFRLRL